MKIPQMFTWRGKPIEDIEKWTKDRNEQMVDYIIKKREITLGGKEITIKEEGTMPETFWVGLHLIGEGLIDIKVVKYRNPK